MIPQIKLSRDLLVANIRSCYYAATQYPLILQAGLSWYERANQEAEMMAKRHHVRLETAIGVISALSPRNPWERNLVAADLCLKVVNDGGDASSFKVTSFNRNKENAVAITKGATPLAILNGPKTRAFYKNILNPLDSCIVTIDGHALHIALNRVAPLEDVFKLDEHSYVLFASCYRQACREINADSMLANVLPCQVQAVCWQYYRVLKGIDKSFGLG